ncbi:hypothetical protein EYR36_011856 [Pleurotus pulmonarius]|nr:hypothetical protein EYR36_011856 [Pleurotus pulmonarius]
MAGFLRKKNTKSQQQAQAQAQATHHQQRQHFQPEPAAAPPQSLPPLYARFATSSKSSSANAGTSTPPKIVSGPMALGSNAGRGLQARNDVNEPRKSAPRESWYKPAPPPDPLPPPRLQVQRTSSPKRHASPNHRSPTHAKPNDHHVPSPMIPDEKPLPIPVLPSTTRQAYNNVPPPASSRRESVMTSPSRPYSRLPAGSGTVPQDPQSQPPYANTLLNSSNHDLPSTRRSILRNANPPPAREELATRLEGNRTEEIRHSPSATPPNQFRTALPPNAFHNVSSRAPVAVVSHPSTVPLSHRTSMQAELVIKFLALTSLLWCHLSPLLLARCSDRVAYDTRTLTRRVSVGLLYVT